MSDRDRITVGEKSIPCTVTDVDRATNQVKLGPEAITVPLTLVPDGFVDKLKAGHTARLTLTLESLHTRAEWSHAFAKQGKSDLQVYKFLEKAALPECHKLHYLQMGAEKIAKAYEMTTALNRPLDTITTRHTGASIDNFVKTYFKMRRGPALKKQGKQEQLDQITKQLGYLAQQIQKCQPAVDREKSPQNVEYPWPDGSKIRVPCDERFFSQDFGPNIWSELLATLEAASDELTKQA